MVDAVALLIDALKDLMLLFALGAVAASCAERFPLRWETAAERCKF